MNFDNVYLHSTGVALPDRILTSDEFEDKLAPVYNRLKLPQGRLELQTGIKSRGYFDKLKPSDIATIAAKDALSKSQVKNEQIDLLIHSSVCRDFLEPSTASVIHHNLKLGAHCQCFDLSNACLGFLNSIIVAAKMLEAGAIKNALIVSGENSKPLIMKMIDFLNNDQTINRKTIKKYIANLTIGSAGVAFVLSNDRTFSHKAQFLGGVSQVDTSAVHLCQGDGSTSELMMETDSEQLLHAGISLAMKTWDEFKRCVVLKDQFHVVNHQVGIAHHKMLMEKLNLPSENEHITYTHLGNTGSAACPITLALAAGENKFSRDESIAMLGIGSGLHSVMLGLEWRDNGK